MVVYFGKSAVSRACWHFQNICSVLVTPSIYGLKARYIYIFQTVQRYNGHVLAKGKRYHQDCSEHVSGLTGRFGMKHVSGFTGRFGVEHIFNGPLSCMSWSTRGIPKILRHEMCHPSLFGCTGRLLGGRAHFQWSVVLHDFGVRGAGFARVYLGGYSTRSPSSPPRRPWFSGGTKSAGEIHYQRLGYRCALTKRVGRTELVAYISCLFSSVQYCGTRPERVPFVFFSILHTVMLLLELRSEGYGAG